MPASLAMNSGPRPAPPTRTLPALVKSLLEEQANLKLFKQELNSAKVDVPKLPASTTQIPYSEVQRIKAAEDLVAEAQTAVEAQIDIVQSLEQEIAAHLPQAAISRITSGSSHIVLHENASSYYGLFLIDGKYHVVHHQYEAQLAEAVTSARRAEGPDFSLAGPFGR
jgi:hypothetical protein